MNMYAIKEKTLKTFLKKTIMYDALDCYNDYSDDFEEKLNLALENYLGHDLTLEEAVDIKLNDFTLLTNN